MFERPRTRRRAHFRGTLLAVATALIATPAQAAVALQGQLTASAGVTDNVTGSPTVPLPGTRGRQTDLIVTLTPSLILTAGSARAVQRLAYTFSGLLYARNSDANTYTNNLSWAGFFIPQKTMTMRLALAVDQGRQSAFNTAIASNDVAPQLRLAGVTNLLRINAEQELAWDISANLRFTQGLGFSTAYFIDQRPPQASTQAIPARLGIERAFARQAFGFVTTLLYTRFLEQRGPVNGIDGTIDPNGVVLPAQGQLVISPLVRYRRDLTYFLAARAEVGAIFVLDPAKPSSNIIGPGGGAGLNFFSRLVNFDLGYARLVTPNLLFRSNFISDQATARLGVLLGERSGFALAIGASYSYLQQLDLSAQPTAKAQAIFGDVTLSYTPLRALSFFLRYQLINQIGRDTDLVPLPSYYTNTLVFGLTALYPTESAADIPRSTNGVRADRRDDGQIPSSRSTPR